jgi:hypothetical protein
VDLGNPVISKVVSEMVLPNVSPDAIFTPILEVEYTFVGCDSVIE